MPLKMVFINNLFVSPLGPQVPCQGPSNSKEHKHHKQPKDSVKDPKASVEGIADPVDGASACILFCCLGENCCLRLLHRVHLYQCRVTFTWGHALSNVM